MPSLRALRPSWSQFRPSRSFLRCFFENFSTFRLKNVEITPWAATIYCALDTQNFQFCQFAWHFSQNVRKRLHNILTIIGGVLYLKLMMQNFPGRRESAFYELEGRDKVDADSRLHHYDDSNSPYFHCNGPCDG